MPLVLLLLLHEREEESGRLTPRRSASELRPLPFPGADVDMVAACLRVGRPTPTELAEELPNSFKAGGLVVFELDGVCCLDGPAICPLEGEVDEAARRVPGLALTSGERGWLPCDLADVTAGMLLDPYGPPISEPVSEQERKDGLSDGRGVMEARFSWTDKWTWN